MHQAGAVRDRQAGGDPAADLDDAGRRQRRLGRDHVREVGAGHELHHQRGAAIDVDQAAHADQVGVVDAGEQPGLDLEPPARPVVGRVAVVQQLAGPHRAAVLDQLDDAAERPGAELATDAIPHTPTLARVARVAAWPRVGPQSWTAPY